jgi:hypothetical protein
MRVILFSTIAKAEPRTRKVRGLNVAGNLTAAQRTKLLLQQRVLRSDELQKADTNRVPVLTEY